MKLSNIKPGSVTGSFQEFLDEGKKADWIALNQGDKIVARGKEYGDHLMVGKTAQEVGDYLEKEGGKYAPYMAQLYLNGDVKKMEDMYQINRLIQKFEEHKRHIPNKDITTYNLEGLHEILSNFEGKISNSHVNQIKDNQLESDGEMTKIIDTPTFEVIVSHTRNASEYLGKNTSVCTASESDDHNMHDHYASDGTLYTIRAGKRRYLLHFETEQLKDEKNLDLKREDIHYLSGFPQWADFLNLMIKKHYYDGNHIEKAIEKRHKTTNPSERVTESAPMIAAAQRSFIGDKYAVLAESMFGKKQ